MRFFSSKGSSYNKFHEIMYIFSHLVHCWILKDWTYNETLTRYFLSDWVSEGEFVSRKEGISCIEICRESYILCIKEVHLANVKVFSTPPYPMLHSFVHLVLMLFYLKFIWRLLNWNSFAELLNDLSFLLTPRQRNLVSLQYHCFRPKILK